MVYDPSDAEEPPKLASVQRLRAARADTADGTAMFDAPSNPRHPPLWHAHADARLATEIFATPEYGKGDPHPKTGLHHPEGRYGYFPL
jgi:hypothetical protein